MWFAMPASAPPQATPPIAPPQATPPKAPPQATPPTARARHSRYDPTLPPLAAKEQRQSKCRLRRLPPGKRRESENQELLSRVSSHTTPSGCVATHPHPQPCKYISNVTCQLCTVGYATIPSCDWNAASFKPYSRADAMRFGSQMRPMQKLLEAEGDWNVGAPLRRECRGLAGDGQRPGFFQCGI